MQKYQNNVQTTKGTAIRGASVLVTDLAGVPITLYSDNGVTVQANPILTGADGEYAFYCANGRYDITISIPGYVLEPITDVPIYDPADVTGVTGVSLAATSGAALVGYQPASPLSVATTVRQHLDDEAVSIFRFMTVAEKANVSQRLATLDVTNAIQKALDSGELTIRLPGGRYRVEGDLLTRPAAGGATRCGLRLIGAGCGDLGNGTVLKYYGTGTLLSNGSDNGNAWDAADYDGTSGLSLESMTLLHGNAVTPLLNGLGNYGAGCALKDWRGGGLKLKDIHFQNFETSLWLIQSDFTAIEDSKVRWSRNGIYIGPRSDQVAIKGVESTFCDTALTIDTAHNTKIDGWTTYQDGSTGTLPMYIKANYLRGQGVGAGYTSTNTIFENLWCEHQAAHAQTVRAFVGVGVDSAYPVSNVEIRNPILVNAVSPAAARTKSLVQMANADGLGIIRPAGAYSKNAIIDQLIEFTGATTPTGVVIEYGVQRPPSHINTGTGAPVIDFAGAGLSPTITPEASLSYTWANDVGSPLEALTSSGTTITSAINSTLAGQANSSRFSATAGEVRCVEIFLTLNSGFAPFINIFSGDSSTSNLTQTLGAGYNRITYTEKVSGTQSWILLRHTDGVLGDWSATTAIHKIALTAAAQQGVASANHGSIVRSVVEAVKVPLVAATFDIPVNVPSGSKLLGVQIKVDSALAGGETWSAAYTGGSTTALAAAGQLVAAGTYVTKMHLDEIASSNTNVRITRDAGSFSGAGQMSCVVFYETIG